MISFEFYSYFSLFLEIIRISLYHTLKCNIASVGGGVLYKPLNFKEFKTSIDFEKSSIYFGDHFDIKFSVALIALR